MVKWDDADVKEFKEEARKAQQEYCDLLGDREWDEIEKSDWNVLRRKVGYGVYGNPGSEPTDENQNTGYDEKQLGVIEKICRQLVEGFDFDDQSIHFACVFVILKIHGQRSQEPVFRAKRQNESSSKCIFCDTGARKYSCWDDYLEKNTLPKCIYCYPTRGLYELNSDDEVNVKFGTSPACDISSRVLRYLDIAATGVSLATTAVGIAALCTVPVAGPILAATAFGGTTTGVYAVSRSSYVLHDRRIHGQSIALTDPEALGCYISIAGSCLGFAQGRMIAHMSNAARAGNVMSQTGRIIFMVVQTGNLTVNGIGIAHHLAVLIDKKERDELKPLDVFQLCASILFFSNSLVNMKTASTIIKEVQRDVIDSHRQPLSEKATKLFDKQTAKLRGRHEMHGNARVIKGLNKISKTKDLYEMMVNENVDSRKVRLTPKGFKGLLNVNENLKIHPLKLVEISPEERAAIYAATRKFHSDGCKNTAEFHESIKVICRKHRITFESMREDTMKRLCEMFGAKDPEDITFEGEKIFCNMTPHEIDRIGVVLANTVKYNEEILQLTTEVAKQTDCKTVNAFISCTEYVVEKLKEAAKNHHTNYKEQLEAAQSERGFNRSNFDEKYGIRTGMHRKVFFAQKTLEEFNSPEGRAMLANSFKSDSDRIATLNQKNELGFFSNESAVFHWVKHRHFGKMGQLTPEEYFEIAETVVKNPANKQETILSQDGDVAVINYKDSERGIFAVKIEKSNGESGIATVFYNPDLKNG